MFSSYNLYIPTALVPALFYGVPFVSKLKKFEGLRFMLVFTTHDAGIYDSCWYLRRTLVFVIHAGIYDSCWYLRFMLVFTLHAGIYDSSWYLRFVHTNEDPLEFVIQQHNTTWYLHFMLVFTLHAGIYTSCWYL